mgnify:FL=1
MITQNCSKLRINSTKKLPTWGRGVSKNPKSCQNNIVLKRELMLRTLILNLFFVFMGVSIFQSLEIKPLKRFQEYQGCQKNWKDLRITTMIRFAASFQPNLRNIWNIGKLDQNWHVIYNGLAKHGRSQNIMYPSQERKIWCIMVSWFYLIMTFLVARFKMIGYLNGLAKYDWSWAKISNT